ncbi:MAG TPA: DNA internalization-related competence protein ComEC/Rec2 [Gammaproteobacteria bacterium]|nr:DNA internalization-related competence protein ComEC/Rec2 [Gammaproteobacteria bacterium]
MWKSAAAMLAGVLAILMLPELPEAGPLLALSLPIVFVACYWRRLRWLLFLPLGLGWAWLAADQHLSTRLDPSYEGREVMMEGWVSSLPVTHGELNEFEFRIGTLDGRVPGPGIPTTVRLSTQDQSQLPEGGEHWRFSAKLRRPRGFMDPGSFDYEGWLFFHGIGATGYIAHDAMPLPGLRFPLLRLRATLRKRIAAALAGDPYAGMVIALVTGDQSGIAVGQWQVLQATSTVHLMAIAGLHLGVVAGLLFLLVRWLWQRSARLCRRCPAVVAAAIASFAGAFLYACLAGFTLPTQRALIMLSAFTLGVLLRRHMKAADTLALAMLGVLLWDPLAAGEASFWLSFTAVAAILLGFNGRVHAAHGWWRDLLRTQWAVALGLLPLLAFFFQQAGIGSPLANLLIVPIYALCIIPLVLSGALLLMVWPWAGTALLKLAAAAMSLSWPILAWLSGPAATLPTPAAAWYLVVPALFGAACILLPRGMPGRVAAALLMLPLFLIVPSGMAAGDFDVTLLDVGQGLAAVVRTAHHVLIYDTGPKFRSGSDTGLEVLIPYLRSQGLAAPDRVIVSHGDNDHAGGLTSLREAYPDVPVYTGAMDRVSDAMPCRRGQHWDWEGVHFEMLYPEAANPLNGNDASCVLRISGPGGSTLLVGDIMKKGEKRLLASQSDLRSDLLVAPHHGSNSSSTPPFVAAVMPHAVWFPVGYRNRWDFPKSEVEARYLPLATLADTANDGALCMQFRAGFKPVLSMRWRRDASRLWTSH